MSSRPSPAAPTARSPSTCAHWPATCTRGLDFGYPLRLLWEAAAAVPFVAIAATKTGTSLMGYPGAAPHGYRDFSYRRKLAHERTRHGSLA